VAAWACLKQLDPKGDWEPVAWFSKSFSPTQQRYSAYERELFAVVLATEHFRVYLEGQHLTIRTDNSAVRSLLKRRIGDCPRVDSWIIKLQGLE
jgi:arylamine N-acetyltransferase